MEEALDLSFDRLLTMMMMMKVKLVSVALYLRRLNAPAITQVRSTFCRSVSLLININLAFIYVIFK